MYRCVLTDIKMSEEEFNKIGLSEEIRSLKSELEAVSDKLKTQISIESHKSKSKDTMIERSKKLSNVKLSLDTILNAGVDYDILEINLPEDQLVGNKLEINIKSSQKVPGSCIIKQIKFNDDNVCQFI